MESNRHDHVPVAERPSPYVATGGEPGGAKPNRRWLTRSAVAAVIALVAGGGWVMTRERAQSPEAALAETKAFVAETGSYRVKITMENQVTTGTPGGAGAEATTRAVTTGEVGATDRWRMTAEYADVMSEETFTDELVRVGDDVFLRSSGMTSDAAPAAPPWVELPPEEVALTIDDLAESLRWMTEDMGPVDDPAYDGLVVETLLGAYLFDVEQDLTSVVRLVEEATAPAVEERLPGGGVRLRVTLEPVRAIAEVVEDALDEELEPVDVLLDVDAEGRPASARFRAELGSATSRLTIDFSDWGSEPEIAAPAAGEIDQTPWLQEEALRALDPALLVAPASVPEPFTLTDVTVYEGSGQDWDCTSLDLSYADRAVFEQEDLDELDLEEAPYLHLSVYPSACWLEDDAEPFDLVFGGHGARDLDGVREIALGDAIVVIDTTLGDEAVEALAATLGPTSADALIGAAPEPPGGAGTW